jgi:HlyD family secretion protein
MCNFFDLGGFLPNMNKRGILYVVSLLTSFFFLVSCERKSSVAPAYETQTLRRGSIVKTVSSTGSLKPIATVNVLAQMSGKADRVLVDYNDEVKKGDTLVILNTDTLRLQRDQLQAQVKKARSAYELQLINYENQEKLAERNLISQYELRQSRNQLESQIADLALAESNLQVIETEINHYAFITSPIDGIVLVRSINEGATVVEGASANSTAIFVIAENLREMQIESWVGELDINSIREGQEVRFTLEALPGRIFSGAVSSKRLSPSTQDGVVSYNVIIAVDNEDLSLLPGMTCNVDFIEDSRENALLISNAALRYTPSSLSAAEAEALVAAKRPEGTQNNGGTQQNNSAQRSGGGIPGLSPNTGGFGGMPGSRGIPGAGQTSRAQGGVSPGSAPSGGASPGGSSPGSTPPLPKPLWFQNAEGKFDCILVTAGISDGSVTEVSSPALTEEIIANTKFIIRERVK